MDVMKGILIEISQASIVLPPGGTPLYITWGHRCLAIQLILTMVRYQIYMRSYNYRITVVYLCMKTTLFRFIDQMCYYISMLITSEVIWNIYEAVFINGLCVNDTFRMDKCSVHVGCFMYGSTCNDNFAYIQCHAGSIFARSDVIQPLYSQMPDHHIYLNAGHNGSTIFVFRKL